MAAPQLFVETYEVWTGTGPLDPAKKKLHDGILTRPTAQNLVDSYVQMYASKLVDPANFNAAPTFFIQVASKGALDLPGVAFDAVAVHNFLKLQPCSVPTYVRVRDTNGAASMVQIGVTLGSSLDADAT